MITKKESQVENFFFDKKETRIKRKSYSYTPAEKIKTWALIG